MLPLWWTWKGRLKWFSVARHDTRENRRWLADGPRFLVVRHSARHPHMYGEFLQWVASEFPDCRSRYELRLLPCRLSAAGPYVLHIPWLQDPVQAWSPPGYRQACRLSDDCDRLGIPIINRVECLASAAKLEGSLRMRRAGLRTARMVLIDDEQAFRRTLGGLALPLLIRENCGHGGRIQRITCPADLATVDLRSYCQPVAVEFIETRSPRDGLYRRYRYFLAGEIGLSTSLHITRHWEARGACRVNDETCEREDFDFVSRPNPHAALFRQARRELGLDFVAFDYAYDPQGDLVVWEANPFPCIRFPKHPHHRRYLAPIVERAYASMLHLHLTHAGLPIPGRLTSLLPDSATERNSLTACHKISA
jgi:hypothetical protein